MVFDIILNGVVGVNDFTRGAVENHPMRAEIFTIPIDTFTQGVSNHVSTDKFGAIASNFSIPKDIGLLKVFDIKVPTRETRDRFRPHADQIKSLGHGQTGMNPKESEQRSLIDKRE
jgi:hypothetical protein